MGSLFFFLLSETKSERPRVRSRAGVRVIE